MIDYVIVLVCIVQADQRAVFARLPREGFLASELVVIVTTFLAVPIDFRKDALAAADTLRAWSHDYLLCEPKLISNCALVARLRCSLPPFEL